MRFPPAHTFSTERSLPLVLFAMLLLDTGYSFVQHLHVALDGDLAPIVVPAAWYRQVLQDPFGLGILQGEHYSAPNRFFVHWAMATYLQNAPHWWQIVAAPVDSIYLASAAFKTAVQLLIIAALASGITADKGGFRFKNWIIAAVLVMPLFQTNGHSLQMGIIEKSITYSFFYPLPLGMVLLFFLPFFKAWHRDGPLDFSLAQYLFLSFLLIALPFSGPLVPAVLLLVCPFVVLAQWCRNFNQMAGFSLVRRAAKAFLMVPAPILFYFIGSSILSLWSIYVGSFNIENTVADAPTIAERYPALLKGCFSIFVQKLGFPLLTAGIFTNLLLVSKFAPQADRQKLKRVGKWLGIFIIAYLLLLPLGGYRDYRSLIVRHDTIMPVTLCLVFFYGFTSFFLLRNLAWKIRRWYVWGIAAFSVMFTVADLPEFQQNACEKAALEAISKSKEKIVKLESNCPVLSWTPIVHPSDSQLNAELLKNWGVTDELRLYYSE